jgi:RNA polymerase primary sigma factor
MPDYDPEKALAMYINEVSTVKPLSKDEESNLFRELAEPGDWDDARESVAGKLIEAHLAQVLSIAQGHSASGVPILELIEEGNRGLIKAVRSFPEKQTGDFTEYAAVCIDEAIKEALQ